MEPALWLPVGPQRPPKYHLKAFDEPDRPSSHEDLHVKAEQREIGYEPYPDT